VHITCTLAMHRVQQMHWHRDSAFSCFKPPILQDTELCTQLMFESDPRLFRDILYRFDDAFPPIS